MTYSVKEIFKTLQGEGTHVGRVAVFCRFAGCNLWSGREQDRSSAICKFCDTDFVGGDKFVSAELLADAIEAAWDGQNAHRYVVFTGGEPLLQLDDVLIQAIRARGFEIGLETNGTLPVPEGIDWICVSPKAGAPLVVQKGHDLKLVYPQPDLLPNTLPQLDFAHFWLQPMDGPSQQINTQAAIAYCLVNPRWRLSVQTHKVIGMP